MLVMSAERRRLDGTRDIETYIQKDAGNVTVNSELGYRNRESNLGHQRARRSMSMTHIL